MVLLILGAVGGLVGEWMGGRGMGKRAEEGGQGRRRGGEREGQEVCVLRAGGRAELTGTPHAMPAVPSSRYIQGNLKLAEIPVLPSSLQKL
jgi:hypothetical protein